jgi:hypothetical protein
MHVSSFCEIKFRGELNSFTSLFRKLNHFRVALSPLRVWCLKGTGLVSSCPFSYPVCLQPLTEPPPPPTTITILTINPTIHSLTTH